MFFPVFPYQCQIGIGITVTAQMCTGIISSNIRGDHASAVPVFQALIFLRSRGKVNPTVYAIEKDGMDNADCIMCVSELTRQ